MVSHDRKARAADRREDPVRRGAPIAPTDRAGARRLYPAHQDVHGPGDLVGLVCDASAASQARSEDGADQARGQDEPAAGMADFGIEEPDGRIAREKRDDDDRGVGRKQVALDDDHGHAAVLGDIESPQAFHEARPGEARMSASG